MTLLKLDNHIEQVVVKKLVSHGDSRGFFREIVRETDPFFEGATFGQWSHSKMSHNVVKAWHYHHQQTDWWYVAMGVIETVLFDKREKSPTFGKKMIFQMGENDSKDQNREVCVKIPPGVLHGLKVLSSESHLFYITSQVYNPNEEGRLPYDSQLVGHDWGKNVIVAENDKRSFVPKSPPSFF
jgi:dTDP-4-dehydrorhamnose 3,5-epimerase